MERRALQTVDDAFKSIYDDIARMKHTLAEHYFNYKLETITDLRLSLDDVHYGVMEIVEQDIGMIRDTVAVDPKAFVRRGVIAELEARIADVLNAMEKEILVKIEPEPELEDRSVSVEEMFETEEPGRSGGGMAPMAQGDLHKRSRMERFGDWTPYL